MKISTALLGCWLDKRLDFSLNTMASYTRVTRRFFDYVGEADIEAATPMMSAVFSPICALTPA